MRFPVFYRFCLAFTALALSFGVARANNIVVHTTPALIKSGPGLGANEAYIQFGIRWDNSWRVFKGADAWDAAWVFIKWAPMTAIRKGPWKHVYLNTDKTRHAAAASSDPVTLDVGVTQGKGMGVFAYRSNHGSGTLSIDTLNLHWNYSGLNIDNIDSVDFRIFAVEMVYVPAGSFMMGDGSPIVPNATFNATYSSLWNPTTGGNANNLQDNFAGSAYNGNDLTRKLNKPIDAGTRYKGNAIPAAFPKGLSACYVMKYEITQHAYVDFLNTLELPQQVSRTWIPPSTPVMPVAPLAVGPATASTYRNFIRLRTGPKILNSNQDTVPAVYGHSMNPMRTGWRLAENGGYIACNFLDLWDGLAYADWAGLRPMTEMEYEKVCRGPGEPMIGTFAWGQRIAVFAERIDSANMGGERFFQGNFQPMDGSASPDGTRYYVVRAGAFAKNLTTRNEAGAAYYGAMNMSDNVWERVISLDGGLGFTGEHGDGVLTFDGYSNTANWPMFPPRPNDAAYVKFGSRGNQISNRTWSNPTGTNNFLGAPEYQGVKSDQPATTLANYGFRAVRTAP